MSVSRKDWSALSSLARQRTLEDEEEQERERRRRHRNLSSTTDDESLKLTQNGTKQAVERMPSVEEAEVPKPPPSAFKDEDEDFQAILRTRKDRRQRRQAMESVQAPVQERLEVEEERGSLGPEQTLQQPVVPKKELEPPSRRRLSREQRGPWAQEEECLEGREPGAGKKGLPEEAAAQEKTSVSEKSLVLEKPAAPAKRLASEKGTATEQASLTEKRRSLEKSVLERKNVSEKSPVPEKSLVSLKTAALEKRSAPEKAVVPGKTQERTLVSERASVFEKSSVSETKRAPRRAATSEESQTPGGSQATSREPRERAFPGKSSPSPAEQEVSDRPTKASRLPPITLQVKIPSKDEEADTSSPTLLTYSSSLKRSSPRTISFDESQERQLRNDLNSQRSESVRAPGSSRTEFMVAPAGVASKRHLFEKELASQNRAEPTSSRKDNLRLSGVVTSRLNLWISRSQESGDQAPQEVRREAAVTRRTQWGNKSVTSLDAEV